MAQLGSVDLVVIVPASPEAPGQPTTPLAPGDPHPVPQTGRPPGLAFTGIDAGVLLLIALALALAGIALHRMTRRPDTTPQGGDPR